MDVWNLGARVWRDGRYRCAVQAIFLAALLTACAAPPPTERIAFAASGTAIVRTGVAGGFYLFGGQSVAITRIDDTSLVDRDNRPLYRAVEVYPGLRTVYFVYRYAGFCVAGDGPCAMRLTRRGRLTFEAKPGRVYQVAAIYRKGRLWSWIIDENANVYVAGDAPGSANWASESEQFGIATQF